MTDPLWAFDFILRECGGLLRSTDQSIRESSIIIIEDMCKEQLEQAKRAGEKDGRQSLV